MTRKKIGIYCTVIWGNNNKTCRCHRCHPMPSPLDPEHMPLLQLGGRTDRQTGCGAGTNKASQFIDLGNVQRNTPTRTWSAWKRTQEDPARLEWVQTAARCQQSYLPPMRGCQPAGSWLSRVGRSCQPGLVAGWGACTPSLVEPHFPPVSPPLPGRSVS